MHRAHDKSFGSGTVREIRAKGRATSEIRARNGQQADSVSRSVGGSFCPMSQPNPDAFIWASTHDFFYFSFLINIQEINRTKLFFLRSDIFKSRLMKESRHVYCVTQKSVKLTGLGCSGVTTESRHLLRLFDTVESSHTIYMDPTYS
jgi:hypothetical protein